MSDEVRLLIAGSWPRCVTTTLAQGDPPKDAAILRGAAQHNQPNLGVYADVIAGGAISRHDPATLPDRTQATAKLEEADVETQPTSLYDRLGGIYSIATAVDDFIDRIMVDDRLNANPRVDEAHHRVLPPGFKYLVTEQLCEAAGGPQRYTGRSMEDSHRDMLITAEEWEAFVDDLNQTLDKFEVPQQERSEVLAIIDSTRDDIVIGD
jgi:hemoglobin